jgi:hypothetical protein
MTATVQMVLFHSTWSPTTGAPPTFWAMKWPGHVRVNALELQAVQGRNRAQLGIAFEHEVAEEAQIQTALRRLAEQFAQGRKVVFMADHAEQIADFQHRTTRRMEQLLATKQCGDTCASGIFSSRRAAPMHHFSAPRR